MAGEGTSDGNNPESVVVIEMPPPGAISDFPNHHTVIKQLLDYKKWRSEYHYCLIMEEGGWKAWLKERSITGVEQLREWPYAVLLPLFTVGMLFEQGDLHHHHGTLDATENEIIWSIVILVLGTGVTNKIGKVVYNWKGQPTYRDPKLFRDYLVNLSKTMTTDNSAQKTLLTPDVNNREECQKFSTFHNKVFRALLVENERAAAFMLESLCRTVPYTWHQPPYSVPLEVADTQAEPASSAAPETAITSEAVMSTLHVAPSTSPLYATAVIGNQWKRRLGLPNGATEENVEEKIRTINDNACTIEQKLAEQAGMEKEQQIAQATPELNTSLDHLATSLMIHVQEFFSPGLHEELDDKINKEIGRLKDTFKKYLIQLVNRELILSGINFVEEFGKIEKTLLSYIKLENITKLSNNPGAARDRENRAKRSIENAVGFKRKMMRDYLRNYQPLSTTQSDQDRFNERIKRARCVYAINRAIEEAQGTPLSSLYNPIYGQVPVPTLASISMFPHIYDQPRPPDSAGSSALTADVHTYDQPRPPDDAGSSALAGEEHTYDQPNPPVSGRYHYLAPSEAEVSGDDRRKWVDDPRTLNLQYGQRANLVYGDQNTFQLRSNVEVADFYDPQEARSTQVHAEKNKQRNEARRGDIALEEPHGRFAIWDEFNPGAIAVHLASKARHHIYQKDKKRQCGALAQWFKWIVGSVNPFKLDNSKQSLESQWYNKAHVLAHLLHEGKHYDRWEHWICRDSINTKAFGSLNDEQKVWMIFTLLSGPDYAKFSALSLLQDPDFSLNELNAFMRQYIKFMQQHLNDSSVDKQIKEAHKQVFVEQLMWLTEISAERETDPQDGSVKNPGRIARFLNQHARKSGIIMHMLSETLTYGDSIHHNEVVEPLLSAVKKDPKAKNLSLIGQLLYLERELQRELYGVSLDDDSTASQGLNEENVGKAIKQACIRETLESLTWLIRYHAAREHACKLFWIMENKDRRCELLEDMVAQDANMVLLIFDLSPQNLQRLLVEMPLGSDLTLLDCLVEKPTIEKTQRLFQLFAHLIRKDANYVNSIQRFLQRHELFIDWLLEDEDRVGQLSAILQEPEVKQKERFEIIRQLIVAIVANGHWAPFIKGEALNHLYRQFFSEQSVSQFFDAMITPNVPAAVKKQLYSAIELLVFYLQENCPDGADQTAVYNLLNTVEADELVYDTITENDLPRWRTIEQHVIYAWLKADRRRGATDNTEGKLLAHEYILSKLDVAQNNYHYNSAAELILVNLESLEEVDDQYRWNIIYKAIHQLAQIDTNPDNRRENPTYALTVSKLTSSANWKFWNQNTAALIKHLSTLAKHGSGRIEVSSQQQVDGQQLDPTVIKDVWQQLMAQLVHAILSPEQIEQNLFCNFATEALPALLRHLTPTNGPVRLHYELIEDFLNLLPDEIKGDENTFNRVKQRLALAYAYNRWKRLPRPSCWDFWPCWSSSSTQRKRLDLQVQDMMQQVFPGDFESDRENLQDELVLPPDFFDWLQQQGQQQHVPARHPPRHPRQTGPSGGPSPYRDAGTMSSFNRLDYSDEETGDNDNNALAHERTPLTTGNDAGYGT